LVWSVDVVGLKVGTIVEVPLAVPVAVSAVGIGCTLVPLVIVVVDVAETFCGAWAVVAVVVVTC
jgi:hypothetical protein